MGLSGYKRAGGSKGSSGKKVNSILHRYSGSGKNNLPYQIKMEKKEKLRSQKSAALREYAKLCKREGIESKRVNLGPREASSNEDQVGNKKDKFQKEKNKGLIPFYKEKKRAAETKEERDKQQEGRNTKEEEIAAKNRARKLKNSERMKRTKKGQPLLNNTVKRLLETIKSKD